MAHFPLKRRQTKKPVNPKWDSSNPIVANATSLLSLTNRGATPYDDAEKASWTADTTNGTAPYKYQPVDGSIQFARQDIDEAGIAYYSQSTGLDPETNPVFVMCTYTVLAAPSAANKGVLQLADATRDGTPSLLLRSKSATELGLYAGGIDRYLNIPIDIGNKHVLIYRYDGNTEYDFYDSAKGVWENLSSAVVGNGTTSDKFWLGTGYNAELPVSFEMFVGSVGYAPSLAECKELAKNPYSLYQKTTQLIDITVPAVGGFQPVWAKNTNTLLGNCFYV